MEKEKGFPEAVMNKNESKKINFFQAELMNNSPRHDYLGYLICRHWGLSGAVEGVVRLQHEPIPENRTRVAPGSEISYLIDLVMVANWIVNELLREIKDHPISKLNFGGEKLGELVELIDGETISGKMVMRLASLTGHFHMISCSTERHPRHSKHA